MIDDIKCQLLERIKSNPYFSVQLAKFTDISNAALLLAFVMYCADGNIYQSLFFCKELPTRTTADQVLCCLDNYVTLKGIDCISVYTNGAASMTGIHHVVTKQILEKAEAKWTHCWLHSHNSAIRQIHQNCMMSSLYSCKDHELRKEECTALKIFCSSVRQTQFRSLAAPVPL